MLRSLKVQHRFDSSVDAALFLCLNMLLLFANLTLNLVLIETKFKARFANHNSTFKLKNIAASSKLFTYFYLNNLAYV